MSRKPNKYPEYNNKNIKNRINNIQKAIKYIQKICRQNPKISCKKLTLPRMQQNNRKQKAIENIKFSIKNVKLPKGHIQKMSRK